MDSSGSQVSVKSLSLLDVSLTNLCRRKRPSRDLQASNRHLHRRRNLTVPPNAVIAILRVEMRNAHTDRDTGAIMNAPDLGNVEGTTGNAAMSVRKILEENRHLPHNRYPYQKP